MRVLPSLVIFMVLVDTALVGALLERNHFFQSGAARAETVVVVRPHSSLTTIAEELQTAGAVDSALLFRASVILRRKNAQLKAGEYAFPAHASEAQIMGMMVARKVIEHRITIAEGLTSDMAVAIVNADPVLTGPAPVLPEGSLLPETYLFERGTTRTEILARMHKAQVTLLAQLWPKRKDGLPFMSVDDALKLASIVEKETAIASERPRVAAVYVNRLKNGMKLEADPTIIYGLTKGVALGHALRQSELAAPNPYSTYQIDGLPPTPICNPGRSALAAVLKPLDSGEFYFVADGSGGHVFAKTKAEQDKNVAQWRKLENQAKSTHSDPQLLRLR